MFVLLLFSFSSISISFLCKKIVENNAATRNTSKARVRLEIDTELKFDQSKQNSLNLKLIFFRLIGEVSI